MFLPLMIIYIKKLYESVDDSKLVIKIIIEGILFSVISMPLIFWYPIRNYYKFNQPFFFVVDAAQNLKVAKTDFLSRWILNKELFNFIYEYSASNVWSNLIISSINFLENYTAIPYIPSVVLRILTLILFIISVISMIKYSFKKESTNIFILFITFIAWMIGYIAFNISMPYSCTMHARYILTVFSICIIYIGMLYKNINNKNLKYIILGLSVLFVLISIILIAYLTKMKGAILIILE